MPKAGLIWYSLMSKLTRSAETFSIWVFFDPLYKDPLVLGTNLSLRPLSLFGLYLDRWPVEQVPLVAKQMLGLHRQASLCPRKLSTAAGTGHVSWQCSKLSGISFTCHANRLLGPLPQKDHRAESVGAWHGLIFPKLP